MLTDDEMSKVAPVLRKFMDLLNVDEEAARAYFEAQDAHTVELLWALLDEFLMVPIRATTILWCHPETGDLWSIPSPWDPARLPQLFADGCCAGWTNITTKRREHARMQRLIDAWLDEQEEIPLFPGDYVTIEKENE